MTPAYGATDRVRRAAVDQYIAPARRRGEKRVSLPSGVFGRTLVERDILKKNRFPIICNALQSKIFLRENHLALEEVKGPPSGKSSTVTFVYRIDSLPGLHSLDLAPEHHGVKPFDALHLAIAASTGGDLFLTHDRRPQRLSMPGLSLIASLETDVF